MSLLHNVGDRILNRYRVLEPLGQGGVATTFAAKDEQADRLVALKVMSFQTITDWKVMELFEREARILQTIDHPQIPDYLDYFYLDTESDRLFYLVQELAVGRSLADLVNSGWHTHEADVINMAQQLLTILDYLHWLTPPVIHRDIKPRNIIRQEDGLLYLVDFGAVQAIQFNTFTRSSGTFVGTYGYMPPEQFQGKAYFASDLYSVAATLLFVLTGRSPSDLPQRRMRLDFRDCINVSPTFADWLDKMLDPAVEDRFHSAQEALARLAQVPASLSSNHADGKSSDRKSSESKIVSASLNSTSATSNSKTSLQPPQGTRVRLKTTGNRLLIHIPPKGWGILPAIQMAIAGLLAITGFSALLSTSNAIAALLLFSFWGGLASIPFIFAAFAIARHRYFEFTADQARLYWRCWAMSGRQTAPRQDLNIELLTSSLPNDTASTTLILHGKGLKRMIAPDLTHAEKEWLAQTIHQFLNIQTNSDP